MELFIGLVVGLFCGSILVNMSWKATIKFNAETNCDLLVDGEKYKVKLKEKY
jgi:hypothetical protein